MLPSPFSPPRGRVPIELINLGYHIVQRLGRGSTAEVFEARWRSAQRNIALKVSRKDTHDAAQIVARMQTEWNVGRSLRHPNLIEIYDGGRLSDGRAWLAMERLSGHDLLAELAREGQIEVSRALHFARQICQALEVLHRRGVVHRDIKPENIFLLDEDALVPDHVKLIDLGVLALSANDPGRAHRQTGQFIVGTPLYLAPEQATGQPPDPRTDLYALGGVLYHLLCGHPPFNDDDPTEVVHQHIHTPVPPLAHARPGLPPRLVSLVHRCLAKQIDDRPANATAMIELLDACVCDLQQSVLDQRPATMLPPLPTPSDQVGWRNLLTHIQVQIDRGHPDPLLAEALQQALLAYQHVEQAQQEARQRRADADTAARARIHQRVRQEQRQQQLQEALGRLRGERMQAQAELDQHIDRLRAHDRHYTEDLRQLSLLLNGPISSVPLNRLQQHHLRLDEWLQERDTIVDHIEVMRAQMQRQHEAIALVSAQLLDVDASLNDLRLQEDEEGAQAERSAAHAADIHLITQRFFERVTLRLLLSYTLSLHPEASD